MFRVRRIAAAGAAALAILAAGGGASAYAADAPVLPKSFPPITPIAQADGPGPEAFTGQGRKAKSPVAPGASTMAWGGEFRCTDQWEYIAAKKDSFVIGNCKGGSGGWEMWRANRDWDAVHNWWWDAGYITGSFSGCGWIRQMDSTQSGTTDHTGCAIPVPGGEYYGYCEYIYCNNGTPWVFSNNPPGNGTDGVPVNPRYRCYEFSNFRPWLSGQDPAPHYMGRYVEPSETSPDGAWRLRPRYVARFPATNGAYMVMARDGNYGVGGAGDGNWVFVPLSCF